MTSTTASTSTMEPLLAARQALGAAKLDVALEALAGLRHLNAHDVADRHCLCARCIKSTGCRCELQGEEFVLDVVVADGRGLFYWVPAQLAGSAARDHLAARMTRRLGRHLREPRANPARELAFTRFRIERRR